MSERQDIHELGKGRWRAIHIQLGVPERHLSGKNCSCPMCGGEDRFRWTNLHMRGGYYCNGCGPGSAVDLLMKVNGWDFRQTKAKVMEVLGAAPVEIPKASDGKGRLEQMRAEIWRNARPISIIDPVAKYLARRGIKLTTFPAMLRYAARLGYKHADGKRTYHPAMVAKFVSLDASDCTLHYTYLTDAGCKADLERQKQNACGGIPAGGAVRLANSAETMGVAEGIETALSAAALNDIPVWSTLSADGMEKFEPPKTCRHLIIFSDNDTSFTGQRAAYYLANRLTMDKRYDISVEVRMPPDVDLDWNDILQMEAA
jgi:putative DNA primase/helicase